MFLRLSCLVLASLLFGCPSSPSVVADDAGTDASSATDAAAAADARADDAHVAIDAAPSTPDGGDVDLGTPCDATYVRSCDATGRILYCDVTVHAGTCPNAGQCRTHASGVSACVEPGLDFCVLATYQTRCGDSTHQIYCSPIDGTLGVEVPSPCPADTECRVGSSGSVCAPVAAAPCDVVTFVAACGTDHRYHDCVSGFERITDGCDAGYVCATISGAVYECVDPSLTPCDASFAEHCEHGPDAAVVCSASGFVVHGRCGATDPSCVMVGTHAGCSYPEAASCTASAMLACDAVDGQYLQSCTTTGIPVRTRCIVGTGAFATCACRRLERHPNSFTIECAQIDGTPCATTDS